jgi:hypothetical protein
MVAVGCDAGAGRPNAPAAAGETTPPVAQTTEEAGRPSPTVDQPSVSPTPAATSSPPSESPSSPPSPVATTTDPPAPNNAPRADGAGTVAATAQAVANAQAVGAARTTASAVALLDLESGVIYGAGDIDETYASASLVKVFIAARLLAEGKADDQAVRDRMWQMITLSDDDAASYLYGLAGGEGLVPWINAHYGISGLAPADKPGYWGLTRVTARGMVTFYAAAIEDPAVAPWLLDAMGQAQPYGSDGFAQHFGLPRAAASWRVKQGWMCCLENLTRMHSTGYIDGDRYAVALLAAGPTSMYGSSGAQTLTLMAQALLPNGTVPTA